MRGKVVALNGRTHQRQGKHNQCGDKLSLSMGEGTIDKELRGSTVAERCPRRGKGHNKESDIKKQHIPSISDTGHSAVAGGRLTCKVQLHRVAVAARLVVVLCFIYISAENAPL